MNLKIALAASVAFFSLATVYGQDIKPTPVAPAAATEKITIAAAANISSIGDQLKAAFLARYPKASLDFVFSATGTLNSQIRAGAEFDIFMSADVATAAKLQEAGFASGPATVYATGKLILLSAKPTDFSKGPGVVLDPSVKQFAIANPEIAPYGKAAQEALQALGIWEAAKAKAATAQSISQALQFALTAADLGFVNKSALYTKDASKYDKEGTYWIEIDPKLYHPIEQAFVVLKPGAAKPTARAFADFLSSKEAKEIFVRNGYGVQ